MQDVTQPVDDAVPEVDDFFNYDVGYHFEDRGLCGVMRWCLIE